MLSIEQLKKRPLDREPHLPLALGAAIEVEGNLLAAQGRRSEAVTFLQELKEDPGPIQLETLLAEIGKLERVKAIGLPADLDGVFYRVGPDPQYPKPDKYMMDIPFDGEGHISMFVNRVPEAQAWIASKF